MHPDVRSLAGWTPIRWVWQDGQPFVEWCQFGDGRFTAPFFAQTVRSAQARGRATRVTPADVLARFADHPPDLPLTGLIFHLSRCGSTLASRMLGALGSQVVVSEPEALSALRHAAGWPGVGETARTVWWRGLIHAYGMRRFPEERRLFIKLDPWNVLDLAVIRAAFPKVPCVYLYRDPVEILMSLSDSTAAAFAPTPDGAACLGLEFVEALSLSNEEYCARVLGRLARAAAETAMAWRLVNYRQLPGAMETVIGPWFGLAPDPSEQETMRQVADFHAKAPGRLVFQADSARKQRDADETIRELARRWVEPAYHELEQARLPRS